MAYATGSSQIEKGQKVFDGGGLLEVGVRSQHSLGYMIEAHCLQSSHPKEAPHEIKIKTESKPISEWKCVCSCKAGLGGKCKHIFAVLLHIQQLVNTYQNL